MLNVLNDAGSLYPKDLLPLGKDKRKGLCSGKEPLLIEVALTYHMTYGDRSFSTAGP